VIRPVELPADVAPALQARLGDAVSLDTPTADLTTYRLGGPAAVLVRATSESALRDITAVLHDHDVSVLVVGRGSNLLVADRGFSGVVVVLDGDFGSVDLDGDHVVAGGAVALPRLARQAAAAGRSGLEFYVGIPGTVGGAVRMNAGGHGRETRDVLVSARVLDLRGDGDPRRLRVGRADPAACRARIDEIVEWRREHQPGGANAGSVFRNPPGDSAGRLIESCGLKGFRVGGAVVSPKHANFFQAEIGATADDVHGLVLDVRKQVERATGIRLDPELQMVGFDEEDEGA
jgi:UDP-N-acetylmuramate dehydrogenase